MDDGTITTKLKVHIYLFKDFWIDLKCEFQESWYCAGASDSEIIWQEYFDTFIFAKYVQPFLKLP